ncbi:MAG: methyltransferase domain-containing protein [Acidobacteria bacterium]|jgi:SAM-dependent methyltransferase|nr:methyltransferase domain-containing protein [Acidobacteriota bacterium]
MGFVRHKYTKAYFLKKDPLGNPTLYGAEGVEEFKKGKVREFDLNILQRVDFSGKTVLDLGHGRGAMIKYAKERGAAKVVGVDFSPDAHAIAKEFLNHYQVAADLYCDDALHFFKSYAKEEDNKSFDIVLMLDFIEHVPRSELTEILKRMHDVLAARAIIVINTPIYPIDNDVIRDGLNPRARDTSDEYEETSGMHCNRYTSQSLHNYMKDCGFLAIGGHFFVPALPMSTSLEESNDAWTNAFTMGFPVLPSAQTQPERFEYAFSRDMSRRRQNNPFRRGLGFCIKMGRTLLQGVTHKKNSFFRQMATFCLPRIAKETQNFDHWQNLGFHIVPVHFHQPIPDTRTLGDEIWKKTSELVGIDMNIKKQHELLTEKFPPFTEEWGFPREQTAIAHEFYRKNGAFLTVDAEVFHCMIRYFKPKTIIEVGSGSTTYLAARACLMNWGKNQVKTELFSIDPHPNKIVRSGFQGLSGLMEKKLQDVDLDYFSKLRANDILFIDSTHVIQIGGDVNYIFLEIIPRLKKGVIIHIHDIFIPREYPKKWTFKDRFFWTEQYILQAFLSFNPAFEVLWGSSFMHVNYPAALEKVFPAFRDLGKDYPFYPDVWPSSFWFRRVLD